MIYLQALILCAALYFSLHYLGVLCCFMGRALNQKDSTIQVSSMLMPAVLWSMFYLSCRL